MDILYHITAEFPAVFLVNGVFFESAETIEYTESGVLYVTVFPLDAVYNPYTVKLANGKAYSNAELCVVYRLGRDNIYVRLNPRYNYVYAPKSENPKPQSLPARFFAYVKSGNIRAARTLMTAELSATVADQALAAFFDTYSDLVEADGAIYCIDADGNGVPFRFTLRSGLIDDVTEAEPY